MVCGDKPHLPPDHPAHCPPSFPTLSPHPGISVTPLLALQFSSNLSAPPRPAPPPSAYHLVIQPLLNAFPISTGFQVCSVSCHLCIEPCIHGACSFEARPIRATEGLTLRPQVPRGQCVDMLVCEDGLVRVCTFLHTTSQPAFTR